MLPKLVPAANAVANERIGIVFVPVMGRAFLGSWITTLLAACFLLSGAVPRYLQSPLPAGVRARGYLGFDRNRFPGDATLGLLKQTFSFAGYWLNNPPGESSNTWRAKREILSSYGFGFLVLFNGRLDRELKSPSAAKLLGMRDATVAVGAAKKEGFPQGAVIFLDQEEGGRMLPEQRQYVYAWVDGVNASGYRAGVYCSGMPVQEGGGRTIISANDLSDKRAGRDIVFFVYNDSCPPSSGCTLSQNVPSPDQGGVPFASVWQYAQSPRWPEFTAACPAHYAADDQCYAPTVAGIYVDLDSASSPDPSSGRR